MTDVSAPAPYRPRNKVRFVTAAALFDGHDAAINIIRRLLMNTGAEVIHLGHNRSVDEVVNAALQEDVQGIAISSYQGGHIEYFKAAATLAQIRAQFGNDAVVHARLHEGYLPEACYGWEPLPRLTLPRPSPTPTQAR